MLNVKTKKEIRLKLKMPNCLKEFMSGALLALIRTTNRCDTIDLVKVIGTWNCEICWPKGMWHGLKGCTYHGLKVSCAQVKISRSYGFKVSWSSDVRKVSKDWTCLFLAKRGGGGARGYERVTNVPKENEIRNILGETHPPGRRKNN